MTYYEILEVNETASKEVIHMAHKALCKKYHPDVYDGDKAVAEERMKQINTAYDVLSDDAKRMEYDRYLNSKRNQPHEANPPPTQETAKEQKPKMPKFPSGKRSVLVIGLLSFLSFSQVIHPYIENSELHDYAFGFGFRDFALLNLIMLIVPLFVLAFKREHTIKSVKLLCLFNSIGVFLVSLILYLSQITVAMSIGWILAVIHYFINKHILLQLVKQEYDSKKKVSIASIVCASLLFVVIMLTLLINSVFTPNNNSGQSDDTANDIGYSTDSTSNSFSDWTKEKKEKADFLDKNIVFVIDGFGQYFYTYDEMVYVTKELDEYEFWAYNKDQAIALDYVASNVNVPGGSFSEKADFLDEQIAFVIDGFGQYYYTYDEMIKVTEEMDEYEYWAYNTEQAISLGYKHH